MSSTSSRSTWCRSARAASRCCWRSARPSTTATFDNEVFYYISQTRVRRVAFDKPKLVDQRVLAVYFGEDGRVTQIANYGMQDGKVFDFISRTTPTGGKDQNFLSQMLAGASARSRPIILRRRRQSAGAGGP